MALANGASPIRDSPKAYSIFMAVFRSPGKCSPWTFMIKMIAAVKSFRRNLLRPLPLDDALECANRR